ncbi:hypothetical protein KLVAMA180M_13895 [Klebsiella variicola subsp. variicola]
MLRFRHRKEITVGAQTVLIDITEIKPGQDPVITAILDLLCKHSFDLLCRAVAVRFMTAEIGFRHRLIIEIDGFLFSSCYGNLNDNDFFIIKFDDL